MFDVASRFGLTCIPHGVILDEHGQVECNYVDFPEKLQSALKLSNAFRSASKAEPDIDPEPPDAASTLRRVTSAVASAVVVTHTQW